MAMTCGKFLAEHGSGKLILTRHLMQRLRERLCRFVRRTEARKALREAVKLTPEQAALLGLRFDRRDGRRGRKSWFFLATLDGVRLVVVLGRRGFSCIACVTAWMLESPRASGGLPIEFVLGYRGTRRERARLARNRFGAFSGEARAPVALSLPGAGPGLRKSRRRPRHAPVRGSSGWADPSIFDLGEAS